MTKRSLCTVAFAAALTLVAGSLMADPPGESGAIGARIDHATLATMSYEDAIAEGQRIFTTPFNRLDGYGDGPIDPGGTIVPGGRPSLQGNGIFLRVNGLDAQSCFECHALVSNATVPATLGIGGGGGSVTNAIVQPDLIDPIDLDLDGTADFTGRFVNPPVVFGVGGVELIALEMTTELQALKQQVIDNPGIPVQLITKGIDFGTIVADGFGDVDTSLVVGVSEDLVIRPFGRKGEFATTRDFDLGAMMFHFGMQPIEVVGAGVDADGDTVVDEITAGEISALSVFLSSMPRPVRDELNREATQGKGLFGLIGCDGCHIPFIDSNGPMLPLRFPQVATDPSQNVYRKVDLTLSPANFDAAPGGGIRVPLFADLKRHDMGAGMAENFALADAATNREYTTAKLWGVVDGGPWMHDGRAHTLTDAILMHGGEGQAARDAFDGLTSPEKKSVLTFLRTLRNPGMAEDDDGDDDDHDDHDDHDHNDHDHDDGGRLRGFVEPDSGARYLANGVDIREN